MKCDVGHYIGEAMLSFRKAPLILPPQADRYRRVVRLLPIIFCLLGCGLTEIRGATLVHDFYLPMPEAQIRQTFTALETNVGTTLDSVFSVVITGEGTRIHYDQWEDGYEIDLANPSQPTTRIWGDGNDANGIPPGYTNDPPSFPAGTVLALRNLVPLPRNPANLLFDARDRMAATKALVVSRAAWATSPGSVLAGAVEVTATIDYGSSYISPVGQDLTNALFQYVGLMVMAEQDGTSVTIDTDGAGPTPSFLVTLNRGESQLVNGGVRKGGSVTTTKPVQVNLVIGHIRARYATDWFTLYPTNQWSDSYSTPVGTATNGNGTFVYLYNPGPAAITINYLTRVSSGSFPIASNGVYQFQMPQNSGARFTSAAGQRFFALSTAGANPSSDAAFDWGFTLLPEEGLTTEAVVGWGPGSSDGTQNGSPVWVTPAAATRVYVDYNGDKNGPLTDPRGNRYDVHYDMAALESRSLFDPDRDQTAMRLYTLDGVVINAAWGEDPAVASPGNPYLDFGTTVLPFPVPVLKKSSVIFTDNGAPGLTVGDVVEYTIELDNKGLLPLGNVLVIDAPPPSLAYVTNSATHNGVAISDGVSGTPFPLDAPGYTIPIILRAGSSVFKYRATILTAGGISNSVSAAGYNLSAQNSVVATPGGSSLCDLAFTDAGGVPVASYPIGGNIYVRLTDSDANTSSNSTQTVTVIVRNLTRGDFETVLLTETGTNTGVFRNTGGLASSPSAGLAPEDGTLNASPGESLSVSYTDPTFGDTCSAGAAIQIPSFTKVLYLSTDGAGSPDQDLDRVNPAAAPVDNTTAQTADLGLGTSTVTAGNISSTGVTATATVTLPHTTAAGADRLLMVSIAYVKDQVSRTVAAVTYGSQSFTFKATQSDGGNELAIDVWYLVAPNVGTTNVVVTLSSASAGIAVGASSFTGVDQNTPLGPAATAQLADGSGTSNPTVTVASAANELVFDAVARDNVGALTVNSSQTQLLNTIATGEIRGAASTKPGAASVTMIWTNGAANEGWCIAAMGIRPAPSGTNMTTFTQILSFCQNFVMPSGGTVTVTNFVTIISGSMPVNPAITAQLKYSATRLITLSNGIYSAADSNLVWSGVLGSNVTVPAGQAIDLVISNAQAGVTFRVDYDSAAKPSIISLPTTTVINVDALGVYDAPYPGGSLVSAPANGSTLYVRAAVSDPFGSYDVTSVNLAIDGPGTGGDLNVTLTNTSVVADDGCSKTYEYIWQTGTTSGNYSISATANEGTEGISDVAATSLTLTYLDNGTPSATQFTSGNNGPATNAFPTNASACVRITDLDQNSSPALAETLMVTVTSSSDSETLTLTETSTNSGVFTACLATSTSGGSGNNNGTLNAPAGSVLTASYIDPTDAGDQSSATSTILTPPGTPAVTMNKTLLSPSDGQAGVGETVHFNLQIVNSGSTTLTNISVTDNFPASAFSFQSASLTPGTVGSGTLTWTNVGPLNPGQSTNIVVSFTATNTAASAINSATASAGGSTTNLDTTAVTITRAALTITKTLLNPISGPVNIGSNLTFRIVVQNSGDTSIPILPLEDAFSASCLQFLSATVTPDGAGAGSLLWNDVTGAGTLATNASISIDVTMRVLGGCDPGNNTARADYAVDNAGNPVPPAVSTVGVTTGAARIIGSVYNDADQSGTLTVGDVGLDNVTIELFTDPDGDGNPADGVLVRLTSTDTSGYYELLNLATGAYVVVETDLPGFASSAPANNRILLNLTSLSTNANNNFFDYLLSPTNYATVSGSVWNDTNLSGAKDVGEAGIANIAIELVQDVNASGLADAGEPVVAGVTTDSAGAYSFPGVVPGNYVIRETDLFGYVSTGDTRPPNDNQIGIVAPAGGSTNGNDFLDFSSGNTPGNDPPIAFNDSFTTLEDTTLNVPADGVLSNDSDVDGDTLTAVLVSGPLNGSLTLNTNGGFIYTPTNNYSGPDSFTYRADDGQTNSGIATVSLNITPANDPPIAVNDATNTLEDVPVTISVLVNDSDPEGTALAITGATTTNGAVSVIGTNVVFTPATNFNGSVTLGYTISDGTNSASGNITVIVAPVNDPPVAVNDTTNTLEDVAVTIHVLLNDSDPEGSSLSIVGAATTNGTVSIVGTNLLFTPGSNFNGAVTLSYTNSDGVSTASATVDVTITPVNDPPAALDDSTNTMEDVSVTISVLVNDSDPEGTPLTITGATTTNGTVNIMSTNLVFIPATNFSGIVTLGYSVSDGTNTASASVTVTITSVNDPPIALSDSTNTLEDVAVIINVLANDSDPEGASLSIVGAATTNGTVSIVGTNLLFTPATNFYGVVTLSYTNGDGASTASANVTVTVNPVNDPPVAVNDSTNTVEDVSVTIRVLINDSDPEGTPLTVTGATTTNGTVSAVGTNVVFTPGTNFNGSVTLGYTISDGTNSASANITVAIAPVNDAPIAVNDTTNTVEDMAVIINVLANDSDPEGAALSVVGTATTNGTVSIVGTNLVFTPATNFNGVVTLSYTNSDGTSTASATVSVTVIPVNDPPQALNDSTNTIEDGSVMISVLINDSDPEGTALTITGATTTNGTVSVVNTSLLFTPATNFAGTVSLGYTISDGTNMASASVTVIVMPINDPPLAANDNTNTVEDVGVIIRVLDNDSDPEGTPLTITGVTTTNGTASVAGTNVVFTPATNFNGTVTLGYTISDGTNTASASVTVTITPVNDPPIALNDSTNTLEDMVVIINVLANDSDPEGTALSIVGAATTNGTVSIVGTNLVFAPATNFNGVVTLSYTNTDGSGTASASVSVTITPVNDPPVAMNDSTNTIEDVSVTIRVLINDSDPEGTPLTITGATTTNGTVSVVGTNLFFTPATNFNNTVTLGYTISDGTNTATANVTVTVTSVNDPPLAINDSTNTVEDVSVTICVLINDSDPDGDALTITGATTTNGTISVVGTNLVFTPATNFVGLATLAYTISDGAATASANAGVTVTPLNDPPAAINDATNTLEDMAVIINVLANDTDAEGDPLTVIGATTTNGTVSVVGTNLFFTPATNFNGTVTLGYTIGDGTNTAAANVLVMVTPVNDPPFAANDSTNTLEDTTATIRVLVNDSDPEGTALSVTGATTTNGTVSVVGTNLVFTPASNFNGAVTLGYTITDGTNSASASVTVIVTAVNDPPIAVGDSTNTVEDQAVTINVLANDSDPEGGALSITGATTTNGTVSVAGTNVLFTPATNFSGTVMFTYTISDGAGTATASVTVTVAPLADLAVLKSGASNVTPGASFVYVITVTNRGPSRATNVLVIDSLPTNVAFVSASAGGVFSSNRVTWPAVASLAEGSATNFSITVTAPTNGTFVNVASASSGTSDPDLLNNDGSSAGARVITSVAPMQFGIQQGTNVFNPQTGLFEQRVTVTNISVSTAAAVRLLVGGLRSGVSFYNATGTNIDGRPYVQHNAPLNPGQTVRLTLEFYVPDRRPFTNSLEAQAALPAPASTNGGSGVVIDRVFLDLRIPGEPRYVIEFTSIPGRTYTIIYSDNGMASWQAATPAITANANRTQWYDDGPPKTTSAPLSITSRFYRVILAP